jgi:hypothetical protein
MANYHASMTTDARSRILAAGLVPFSNEERGRLRLYVEKADEIRSSRFFERQHVIRPNLEEGVPFTYVLENAEREVVSAVMPPLRLLYATTENVSFRGILSLIGRKAVERSSPESARIRTALRQFSRAATEVLKFDPDMGISSVDENGDLVTVSKPTMREILEDWLYGEYLHTDPLRRARLDQWRSIGVHEKLFLDAVRSLGDVYIQFADEIVTPILAESSLASSNS